MGVGLWGLGFRAAASLLAEGWDQGVEGRRWGSGFRVRVGMVPLIPTVLNRDYSTPPH